MTALTHVSLFSGVGGIDLAMSEAGIPTVAACEIDKSARGVLVDRFPDAHLYTDVKEVTGDGLRTLGLDPRRTVLSAGFPCQDVSVAGRRRGMGEGTRTGLYWEVDRILGELAPRWVVLENVPGLLSACCACPGDGTCVDRALAVRCDGDTHAVPGGSCWGECIARHGGVMGAVLGSLADRGYGFAYRVLDAQHFGVPQRRRRVVVVGRLGDDGRAPAQVLLEPEGLLGNPAAGITPRPLFAPAARGGAGVSGVSVVAAPRIAATLTAGTSGAGVSAPGRRQEDDHNIVAFDPKAGGDRTSSGAFEDGTGITPTLQGSRPHAVAFHMTQDPISGAVAPAMGAKSGGMGIAYAMDKTVALDTAQGGPDDNSAQGGHLVATYQKVIRSGARDADGNLPAEVWAERDIAATLNLNDLGSDSRAVEVDGHLDGPGLIVRRLTPTECERLQGFPDGHTATSNGRPQADSPRYKQMGNAVAVPVFAWVARRIAAVDTAIREAATA